MSDIRKILIIGPSFYPDISPRSFRATELAKEFARQGQSVTVFIPFMEGVDYKELSDTFRVQFKNLGKEKLRTFKLKGGKYSILIKRFINRALLMLFEFPDIQIMPLTVKSLCQEDNYDILISIAVPHPIHWGVAWTRTIKHRIAKTWVADCGDPYTGDQMDTFRKFFYFKYIEKWAFRKADFISINVPDGEKSYFPEFYNKIKYIPSGINFSDIQLFTDEISNEPVTFGYAGGFIPKKRDPRPFLEFLSSLNIAFVFIIFTKKKDLIKSFEERMPDKIIIKDYIPRAQLIYFLSGLDFLVNFDNNKEATFPSKLIDYSLTRRPILNITSTLDESTILEFLNKDYSKAFTIENLEQYNIRSIAEEFMKLI